MIDYEYFRNKTKLLKRNKVSETCSLFEIGKYFFFITVIE